MARLKILLGLALFAAGVAAGWHLRPKSREIVTVPSTKTETQVVTKVVEKTVYKDGTVTTREVTKEAKAKAQVTAPKPEKNEYKVGVQSGLDLKPVITAGRRLFGDVWLESTYKPSNKEVTLGLSYEF